MWKANALKTRRNRMQFKISIPRNMVFWFHAEFFFYPFARSLFSDFKRIHEHINYVNCVRRKYSEANISVFELHVVIRIQSWLLQINPFANVRGKKCSTLSQSPILVRGKKNLRFWGEVSVHWCKRFFWVMWKLFRAHIRLANHVFFSSFAFNPCHFHWPCIRVWRENQAVSALARFVAVYIDNLKLE